MATGELTQAEQLALDRDLQTGQQAENADPPRRARAEQNPLTQMLGLFASLKLTVVLFLFSIALVFFGTLAQKDHDIWYVVYNSHFRVWFAFIEWQAIGRLIELFVGGNWGGNVSGFYLPGGNIIGSLLLVNLFSAHSIRFKAAAKGTRLGVGLLAIAAGVALTALVIMSGMDDAIESQLSPALSSGLWHSLRASVAGLALAGVYWLITSDGRLRIAEFAIAGTLIALVACAAIWLFMNPDARLNDSGLRILWQLIKGGAAALLLLVGCVLVFAKRAGIVLLHGGVGLLMIGELLTGLTAEEGQMFIPEGQTVNYTYDTRSTELALTHGSPDGEQQVAVVPERFLANAEPGEIISHQELPVDLRIKSYLPNATLTRELPDENLATTGLGQRYAATELASASGVMGSGINLPAAYVELLEKEKGNSLGTYLVSSLTGQMRNENPEQLVTSENAEYGLSLRFKRTYKDYAVGLIDFQQSNYEATSTPKDFRSVIQLTDSSRNVDRELEIYMNNPLRYAGDTLYQQSFNEDKLRTGEVIQTSTVLQVVSNSGWMIPYISCMLVGVGMLAHFGITLSRFTRRRVDEAERAKRNSEKQAGRSSGVQWTSPAVVIPVAVGLLWGGYLLSKARPATDKAGEMRIHDFGSLPLAEGGRIKPFDTLARNTLQYLSTRQEVVLGEDRDDRLPAINWMLDAITDQKQAREYPVFRIESLEVLDLLGLERRPGSFRYSYNEVLGGENFATLGEQLRLIAGIDKDERSLYQTKIAELGSKVGMYHNLANAFGAPRLGTDPDRIQNELQRAMLKARDLQASGAARAVPPVEVGGEWSTLYQAELNQLFARVKGEEGNVATEALSSALDAYAADDAPAFNSTVRDLKKELAAFEADLNDPANAAAVSGLANAERMSLAKAQFEAFFTQFSPFFYCWISYLVAFVLAVGSWLIYPKVLGRSAVAIVGVTFLVHTFAIIARIYISGRPPVTNLYSSAVFIGWAIVLVGLAFEAMFRMGLGTVLASVFGVATLIIAHNLSLDGDTFTVLVAVLDTQFWLATHVVCITLGYAATFVAGGIAMIWLIGGYTAGAFDKETERVCNRMVYGTLCFAIFFSFIGTVLGGLWADDSWGRFWGWDPKENGALIIVLWNALVLHARWGGMISMRGLAALAVIGNMWTTWSWFGVNELGVGLHAYAGLSDGVSFEAMVLRVVAISHPLILALALVPRETWRNMVSGPTDTQTA